MAKKSSPKIRPLHDRILVEREAQERESAGGIVIPDSAAEKPILGTVIAVGNGRLTEQGSPLPIDVAVGDKVLFAKFSGTDVKVDDKDLLVLREDDVLAVVG
jgi:chaperonin GroES